MHYPTLPKEVKDRAADIGIDLEASTDAFIAQVRNGRFFSQATIDLLRGNLGPSPQLELSPTEQHVMELIAAGAQTEEIGVILGINVNTVMSQRSRIFRKLGARNAPHAVTLYLLHRLMDEEKEEQLAA